MPHCCEPLFSHPFALCKYIHNACLTELDSFGRTFCFFILCVMTFFVDNDRNALERKPNAFQRAEMLNKNPSSVLEGAGCGCMKSQCLKK